MLGGVTGGVIPPGEEIVRRRLWLSAAAVAIAAVLVAAVPVLVVVAIRDPALLALGLPLLAAAVAGAIALARVVADRAARPVEELAEAAGRLGTGDPRPVGRRYGLAELDQVADGLDSASRRVTKPADRRPRAGDRRLASAPHTADRPVDAARGDDRLGGFPGRGQGGRHRRARAGRAARRGSDSPAEPGPAGWVPGRRA